MVAQADRRHSIFEILILAGLITAANWAAFAASPAGMLALFHACFLLSAYMLLRLAVKRLNKWVGKLVFAVCVLLFAADILAQKITGLHINPFILSVMLQPGIASELGFSPYGLWAMAIAGISLGIGGAWRLSTPFMVTSGRRLLALTVIFGLAAQALYSALFYSGVSEIEDVRRKLAFFSAPHPYYRHKILAYFWPAESNNPFASVSPSKASAAPTLPLSVQEKPNKNILLIVSDSLRSKDIAADQTLAPSLYSWAQKGALSLDHYSTSNCTHFSFYSMFTGAFPTEFGAARRNHGAVGLLPALQQNGYGLSTSEANSLDWYDTASIIFPPKTERFISEAETASARDKDVTNQTIATLEKHQKSSKPFFHLSYYFGSHYPYDPALNKDAENKIDRYKLTVRAFDQQLDKLLSHLEQNGMLDNTIVIVTSDHGEEFRTTGRTGHATRLSDEQVKVPFLIIDKNSNATSEVSHPKSHLDVAQFLLAQAAGSEAPASKPVILANCSYDYPSGFALLPGEGPRVDFAYRDGYLTPINGPDGTAASAKDLKAAAAQLIAAINK